MTRQNHSDRTRYRLLFWAALATSLIGFAPLISATASVVTASMMGCEVNAAYARPCIVMGTDISEALYTGFMSLILILFTAPVILVAAVLWILFGVFRVRASTAASSLSPSIPPLKGRTAE
ncbi:MAG: hypothetical protein EON96_05135 [Caulobacteraceae bacterium]|nr:MAG: hypothetical protein EON96_05135 [Caulobacteraceae bacterium]